jgi:hypothetical protein
MPDLQLAKRQAPSTLAPDMQRLRRNDPFRPGRIGQHRKVSKTRHPLGRGGGRPADRNPQMVPATCGPRAPQIRNGAPMRQSSRRLIAPKGTPFLEEGEDGRILRGAAQNSASTTSPAEYSSKRFWLSSRDKAAVNYDLGGIHERLRINHKMINLPIMA